MTVCDGWKKLYNCKRADKFDAENKNFGTNFEINKKWFWLSIPFYNVSGSGTIYVLSEP